MRNNSTTMPNLGAETRKTPKPYQGISKSTRISKLSSSDSRTSKQGLSWCRSSGTVYQGISKPKLPRSWYWAYTYSLTTGWLSSCSWLMLVMPMPRQSTFSCFLQRQSSGHENSISGAWSPTNAGSASVPLSCVAFRSRLQDPRNGVEPVDFCCNDDRPKLATATRHTAARNKSVLCFAIVDNVQFAP